MIKNLPTMQETWVQSLGREDPPEEKMETHSSIIAWRIPWTEDPGGLQSMGSQRVRHDWVTYIHTPAGSQGRGDTGVGNPGPWSMLLALWGLPSLLLFQPGVSGFHLREVISFLCLESNQCQPIAVTILGVSTLHLPLPPLPNPSS